MFTKIKNKFLSETPKIVKLLQGLSGAIAVLTNSYLMLPEELKSNVDNKLLVYVAYSTIVLPILLQFFEKSKK